MNTALIESMKQWPSYILNIIFYLWAMVQINYFYVSYSQRSLRETLVQYFQSWINYLEKV